MRQTKQERKERKRAATIKRGGSKYHLKQIRLGNIKPTKKEA